MHNVWTGFVVPDIQIHTKVDVDVVIVFIERLTLQLDLGSEVLSPGLCS